ncbi:hypothetical protein C0Z16_34825 [Paraburkholderia rhynchosiae]|uniref:Uncharacterized protein n=1 Tax=Paraburkholderia rhynchosiae TaxID=487049 RepID=A0ABX4UTV5_9BURK|nr:hypothetical protein C0Z16_34825 [Paraburkholderia rhynchosiae]
MKARAVRATKYEKFGAHNSARLGFSTGIIGATKAIAATAIPCPSCRQATVYSEASPSWPQLLGDVTNSGICMGLQIVSLDGGPI